MATTVTLLAGSPVTFITPSTTSAPINAGTQLSLAISQLVTTTSITVTLTDPTSAVVLGPTTYTSPTTITYSNAGAVAGAYTWTLTATAPTSLVADGQYLTTFTGSHSFYTLQSTSGLRPYILSIDGVTQRQNTADDYITSTFYPMQFGFTVKGGTTGTYGQFKLGIERNGT